MITSETTAEIFAALVAAELANPLKSEEVQAGQRRYKFAPLPEILDGIRPVLREHGLAVLQEARTVEGFAGVTTRIIHTSGEWIEFAPLFIPSAADAQSMGSVVTYARRYTLLAALGIAADEDDDGERATRTSQRVTGKDPAGSGGTPGDTSTSKAEGTGDTTAPVSEAQPLPPNSNHTPVWIDSPTLSKFEVCAINGCVEHQPRRKKVA